MPTDGVEVSVRRAEGSDADDIAGLYLRTRAASEPAMPAEVHPPEEVRLRVARTVADTETWVAEESGEPVGFVAFTETWLEDLYVAPERQGEGIGSVLLDLVRARLPGGFSLWVFETNEAARAFYRRRGLVELEHTDGSANEEHAPDVRLTWPGVDPLGHLRARIDEVDDDLAVLLARRVALTAAVQDHKAAAGEHAGARGRDAAREQEIVERMSEHAPGLGREQIARVMHTVIAESLAAWEDEPR